MLEFPFNEPPVPGSVIEVAPGILWARLALPFRLDHVNVYFIEDDDGWYIVDTGIANRDTKAAWQALLAGPMAGRRIKGLIVTHHHPDHIGLAGWLCETLDVPMLTSRTSFLSCMTFAHSPAVLEASEYSRFYARHGMSPEIAALVSTQGHDYLRMLSLPPHTYQRLHAGQVLTIGGRRFEILTGDGHCPEQVMLHAPDHGILLAADQVIEKITPNISVMAFEPSGDPLGDFLGSLGRLQTEVSPDVLVLSGHRLPFVGLHERCRALGDHHEERCGLIEAACAEGPKSANDLVPVLFHRPLGPHELSFAFSETLAHLNHMVARRQLDWAVTSEGSVVVHSI
jgi:glyoxylase-like metal-dependent hydrolase (beta-lactamase superfamily II)